MSSLQIVLLIVTVILILAIKFLFLRWYGKRRKDDGDEDNRGE